MISGEYKALLQRQHVETPWGSSTFFRHMEELLVRIRAHPRGTSTVLDFGSGRESLANHAKTIHLPFQVINYDPGTGKDDLPLAADVVVCCDVLEHVERDYLSLNLSTIFNIAQEAVFFVIALRQAKAPLLDGSPAHLIVEPAEFWLKLLWSFRERFNIDRASYVDGKELRVWMTKRQ